MITLSDDPRAIVLISKKKKCHQQNTGRNSWHSLALALWALFGAVIQQTWQDCEAAEAPQETGHLTSHPAMTESGKLHCSHLHFFRILQIINQISLSFGP